MVLLVVVWFVAHGDLFLLNPPPQFAVDEHRAGAGLGRRVVAEDSSDVVEQTGDR